MCVVNVLNLNPREMMVLEFYTFMEKVAIYVLGPELDKLSHEKKADWIRARRGVVSGILTTTAIK